MTSTETNRNSTANSSTVWSKRNLFKILGKAETGLGYGREQCHRWRTDHARLKAQHSHRPASAFSLILWLLQGHFPPLIYFDRWAWSPSVLWDELIIQKKHKMESSVWHTPQGLDPQDGLGRHPRVVVFPTVVRLAGSHLFDPGAILLLLERPAAVAIEQRELLLVVALTHADWSWHRVASAK